MYQGLEPTFRQAYMAALDHPRQASAGVHNLWDQRNESGARCTRPISKVVRQPLVPARLIKAWLSFHC